MCLNDSNTLNPCMHAFSSTLLTRHSMYACTTIQHANKLHLYLSSGIREAHKTQPELYSAISLARNAADGIKHRKMAFDGC